MLRLSSLWREGEGKGREGFFGKGAILLTLVKFYLPSFDWLCWVFNFNRFAWKKMCLVKTWDHPCGFYFRISQKLKSLANFYLKQHSAGGWVVGCTISLFSFLIEWAGCNLVLQQTCLGVNNNHLDDVEIKMVLWPLNIETLRCW